PERVRELQGLPRQFHHHLSTRAARRDRRGGAARARPGVAALRQHERHRAFFTHTSAGDAVGRDDQATGQRRDHVERSHRGPLPPIGAGPDMTAAVTPNDGAPRAPVAERLVAHFADDLGGVVRPGVVPPPTKYAQREAMEIAAGKLERDERIRWHLYYGAV